MNSSMRSKFYMAFDVIGTILAMTEAGFLAAGSHPLALTVSLAVYGAASARVHGLARRNVEK